MITDYLIELSGSLDVPAARRRRIIAEVEDHLQSTAAELHASGYGTDVAEREAVRRFGSAQALAQTFHEDQAARAARTAGRASVLLAALLVLIEVNSARDPHVGSGRVPGGRARVRVRPDRARRRRPDRSSGCTARGRPADPGVCGSRSCCAGPASSRRAPG